MRSLFIILVLGIITGCGTKLTAGDFDYEIDSNVTLTLGELQNRHPDVRQGHGAYMWRRISDNAELWFWYLPSKNVDFKEFEIVLVTSTASEDPIDINIVWPKIYKGEDFKLIYKLLYEGIHPDI